MRKRIIALFLAGCMILSLASCKGKDPAEETRPDSTAGQAGEAVTRGQWITMLADAFGLDTYESAEPHYTDIQAGNPLFAAVQSAAEWGILDALSGERFDADKNITREEVAATAALTAGFEQSDGTSAVDYALQRGIITSKGDLSGDVTQNECENALSAARSVYLSVPAEEIIEVERNPKLEIVKLDSDISSTLSETGSFTVPNERIIEKEGDHITVNMNGEAVKIGLRSIILTEPSARHPFGEARKVERIGFSNTFVSFDTTAPELGDLYDKLIVHAAADADLSNIILENGVSVAAAQASGLAFSNGAEYHVSLLSGTDETPQIARLSGTNGIVNQSYDFSLGEGDFEKTWTRKNSGVLGDGKGAKILDASNYVYDKPPSREDFHGSTDSWTEKLGTENKFSAGYKITGNITINRITVTTDVEYVKADFLGIEFDTDIPQAASLQIDSDIASTLKLEGNLSDRVKIAEIPVPIAATGLTVTVGLYLYADASGFVQVQAAIENTAKAEWEALAKLKHTADSNVETKAEAAIDIAFGADLSASLDAFGAIVIMDVGVKAGGELAADAYVDGKCEVKESDDTTTMTYTESMHVTTNLYAPIASLYIGGEDSLIAKAGISDTWDIIGKDAANTYPLIDEEWEFWREVVTLDKNGNVIDTETTTAGAAQSGDDDLFAQLQRGDFSAFAGTYMPAGIYHDMYGGGQQLPDLILHEDGTISGGLVYGSYSTEKPTVIKNEDGSYLCQLFYQDEDYQEYYIIYPEGVIGPNPYIYNDPLLTSSVYIHCFSFDGGALDIIYYRK